MPSEQRGPDYWLFLEPFVHIAESDDAVLLYNALNGKRFEIRIASPAGRIAGQLSLPENAYVYGLSEEDLHNPDNEKFVGKLKRYFMGDLLETRWSVGKPANFFPEPYFKSHLTKENLSKPEIRDTIDFNDYIHEAVIYLNSFPPDPADPFDGAVNQFVFPGSTVSPIISIPWTLLEPFVHHLTEYRISQIQLSGSDIRKYPELLMLIEKLAGAHIPVQAHILSAHFDPGFASKVLAPRKNRLSIHFTFPISGRDFDEILVSLSEKGLLASTHFHFTVTSTEELDAAREIIRITHLQNAFLNPFFNGKNFDFFRRIVFLTRKDIRSSRPSQHQVFSRKAINETNFGIFTLLPDGMLYANLNDRETGNISLQSLEESILKEITEGVSWFRTRQTVSPCSRCLYRFLCPPVSAYEIVTGRFNFCDIFEV